MYAEERRKIVMISLKLYYTLAVFAKSICAAAVVKRERNPPLLYIQYQGKINTGINSTDSV